MSDISVLSNQYEKLVATSDLINNYVITLKKKAIVDDLQLKKRHINIAVSANDVKLALGSLTPFLRNVQKILKGETQDSEYIPAMILSDYKRRLSLNQYLMEDIDEIVNKNEQNESLNEKNIEVLDEILSIIDIERNALFRKLRTARG